MKNPLYCLSVISLILCGLVLSKINNPSLGLGIFSGVASIFALICHAILQIEDIIKSKE